MYYLSISISISNISLYISIYLCIYRYDNEWSFCAQVIKLLDHMITYNEANNPVKNRFFIENYNYSDKDVVIRVDWNIPSENFIIQDSYRIVSSIKSIDYVINGGANKGIYLYYYLSK
jgi:hypothetical protein